VTATATVSGFSVANRINNGAEFLRSLGDIPPERIIWIPLPGTATEKDLLALVDGDEKRLCELVNGTLVEKPVGYEEGLIALNIAFALKAFIKGRKLGMVNGADGTMRMSGGNIRLPDVSFVAAADIPNGKRPKVAVPKLPPTIAVEVVSEANTAAEMSQKIREYFASGSKLVWMVYPKTGTIAVYEKASAKPKKTLTQRDALSGGSVLPGFSMPVSEVFNVSDFD